MNRRAFCAGLAALAGCVSDRRPRLNVYNWSAYVAPETIPAFEAEFGVRVRYATYEDNEEMLAKVLTGNSGWDVVFPTHSRLEPMSAYNLLAPLRHEWLPHLDNLAAEFRLPEWDPQLRLGVPYMWSATGIVYNRRVMPPPARWADLWNERLKNRITMLDDPEDVLGACLKKLDMPFNTTSAEDLRRAEREALAQKRLVRAYLNAEVRDQLVAGDVLAAQLWSTTAQQAIDGALQANNSLRASDAVDATSVAPQLAFAYPAEGFPFYCDCAVVLRESRRQRLAHQFLDYLLRAPVSAAIAQYTSTATANGAAQALLPAKLRENPTLYPPAEVFRRGEWPRANPPAVQRLRDRIWTEVKSAS
jgi:spermidine/putrescine transport system substrate-binding protein